MPSTATALACPNASRFVQMGKVLAVHCFVVTLKLPLVTTDFLVKASVCGKSHLGVTRGNADDDKASDE